MYLAERVIFAAALIGLATSGCAQRPGSIKPAAMPEGSYSNMSCSKIRAEYREEKSNLDAMMAAQNNAATADAVTLLFLGFPAASLAGSDRAGDISASKGRVLVLEQRLDDCQSNI